MTHSPCCYEGEVAWWEVQQGMNVLHGVMVPPRGEERSDWLFIWGEHDTLPQKRRGRPPIRRSDTPLPHPFQIPANGLLPALRSLVPSAPVGEVVSVTLAIPSTTKMPQPSPLLSLGEPPDQKDMTVAPWVLSGLALPLREAVPLLWDLANRPPNEGTVIGPDLMFWSRASLFLLQLVLKHQFYPTLEQPTGSEDTQIARWQVVLHDPAFSQVAIQLTRAMPPACRATTGLPRTANESLLRFLSSGVSEMVFTTPCRSRIRKGAAAHFLGLVTTGKPSLLPDTIAKTFMSGATRWADGISTIPAKGFITCFRLEEPKDPAYDEQWRLDYLLQSVADPSLLIPAEEIWKRRGEAAALLAMTAPHHEEVFLTSLSRAGQISPLIEESLHMRRPVGISLNSAQAYKFLKESAPLLSESGFGVLVPSWWHARNLRAAMGMSLKVSPRKSAGTGTLTLTTLVSYTWELAIGDDTIGKEEFEALARLKMPLINVRGRWVEVSPEALAAAEKFFSEQHEGEMVLGEAVRIATGMEVPNAALPITEVSASPEIAGVLGELKGEREVTLLAAPSGFHGTLRPYQVTGFSWLAFLKSLGMGACLADDMGLGKTVQLLALMAHAKQEGEEGPVLLICPTSVVGNWVREAARFTPYLSVMVHHGSERQRGGIADDAALFDLVISTYGVVSREAEELCQVEWRGIVLDEAQNIKNPDTKQSRAVRSLHAGFRVALTGTPVENRLFDLWSLMEFLNPGYLGPRREFGRRFAIPVEKSHDQTATATLKAIVQPFVIRRLKTDPAVAPDLPDKIEMTDACTLTKEQATLYEAVVRDMLTRIESEEGITRKGLVLSAIMRLKQICNHPALFLADRSSVPRRSGKLIRLISLLEEVLAEGDAALIFTQFSSMGEILHPYLQEVFGEEVLFLHGGVTRKRREEMVMRFSTPGGPRIFVLSLKAGGVGLNLTRACHVFHFDRWWNPAVENQATDRAFRIGQTKNVMVHKFVCQGTLEERIDEMISRKRGLAEEVIGTGEEWLTELSTGDLRSVLALRHEAIEEA